MNTKRRQKDGYRPLTIFIVVVVTFAVFMLLSTTLLFNTATVRITGSSNYTADEIVAASGIKAGDNLVRLNAGKCEKAIESSLAYIEKAKVSRAFPSTIVISVEACVPTANFICDESTLLISAGGKVLEVTGEPKMGLLNFKGTEPAPELVPGDAFRSADEHKDPAITTLMDYFSASKMADKVTLIDLSNRSEISYTYDNRITVQLGSINDIEYKIKFSEEIIRTKIGDKTEGVLTILSNAKGASFLDKESLEHNAQVYNENMEALNNADDEDGDDEDSDDDGGRSDNTPTME